MHCAAACRICVSEDGATVVESCDPAAVATCGDLDPPLHAPSTMSAKAAATIGVRVMLSNGDGPTALPHHPRWGSRIPPQRDCGDPPRGGWRDEGPPVPSHLLMS